MTQMAEAWAIHGRVNLCERPKSSKTKLPLVGHAGWGTARRAGPARVQRAETFSCTLHVNGACPEPVEGLRQSRRDSAAETFVVSLDLAIAFDITLGLEPISYL